MNETEYQTPGHILGEDGQRHPPGDPDCKHAGRNSRHQIPRIEFNECLRELREISSLALNF